MAGAGLIARGVPLAQIAEQLHLSPKTVTTHKAHLMSKLGIANNADLIRLCRRTQACRARLPPAQRRTAHEPRHPRPGPGPRHRRRLPRAGSPRLPRHLFDYIDGAAYDEVTAGENLRGFQRLTLRQRVLRDVSSLKLSTRVLGQDIAMPVVLAPIGIAGAFARRAEVQAARAAEAAGIPFCESTVSICSIEEVGAATTAPFWYQLYVMRDRGFARELMQRAHAAGCPVLVLTVDLAVMGARYRDIRNGMAGGTSAGGKLCKAWDILSHPGWLLRRRHQGQAADLRQPHPCGTGRAQPARVQGLGGQPVRPGRDLG
jgi:hypothetical protein